MTALTPTQVWQEMVEGNRRFVAGDPEHPHQDVGKRHELAEGQAPVAALFGCSDSRLAAEIIFDKGLGDLFVVRNAGQVIGESIVASLEYAVAVLGVPLIVVLAHDSCGAVRAAVDGTAIDAAPLPPHIWKLVAPIVPAARKVLAENGGTSPADIDADLVGREHLRNTVRDLLQIVRTDQRRGCRRPPRHGRRQLPPRGGNRHSGDYRGHRDRERHRGVRPGT